MNYPLNASRYYPDWDDRNVDDRVPNEALIREVLTFIDLHQERWNQDQFLTRGECGTVGCFAGWASVLCEGEELDLAAFDNPVSFALFKRVQHNRYRVAEILGLSVHQFYKIYDFVNVHDPEESRLRHPTFRELCDRVYEVTGIRYKNGQELA